MTNYPFDTLGLSSGDIEHLNETYTTLKAKFHIEPTGHIDFHLEEFEVFRNYFSIRLIGSFVIKHLGKESYILFVETRVRHLNSKGGAIDDHREYQTWGLSYVRQDFGRVLIRRETLTDKILELVHPVELDFADDKPFSDTFYVLVNDHQKAVKAINRNFRNAVMDIRQDDFSIEIIEHTLIIGDQKSIAPQRAVYLAEFVSRVCSGC